MGARAERLDTGEFERLAAAQEAPKDSGARTTHEVYDDDTLGRVMDVQAEAQHKAGELSGLLERAAIGGRAAQNQVRERGGELQVRMALNREQQRATRADIVLARNEVNDVLNRIPLRFEAGASVNLPGVPPGERWQIAEVNQTDGSYLVKNESGTDQKKIDREQLERFNARQIKPKRGDTLRIPRTNKETGEQYQDDGWEVAKVAGDRVTVVKEAGDQYMVKEFGLSEIQSNMVSELSRGQQARKQMKDAQDRFADLAEQVRRLSGEKDQQGQEVARGEIGLRLGFSDARKLPPGSPERAKAMADLSRAIDQERAKLSGQAKTPELARQLKEMEEMKQEASYWLMQKENADLRMPRRFHPGTEVVIPFADGSKSEMIVRGYDANTDEYLIAESPTAPVERIIREQLEITQDREQKWDILPEEGAVIRLQLEGDAKETDYTFGPQDESRAWTWVHASGSKEGRWVSSDKVRALVRNRLVKTRNNRMQVAQLGPVLAKKGVI